MSTACHQREGSLSAGERKGSWLVDFITKGKCEISPLVSPRIEDEVVEQLVPAWLGPSAALSLCPSDETCALIWLHLSRVVASCRRWSVRSQGSFEEEVTRKA